MFRIGPKLKSFCVLLLVITLVGLFLVSPAQAQSGTDNGIGNDGTNNGKGPDKVPEPMTLTLLGLGLAGLTGLGLRKRR